MGETIPSASTITIAITDANDKFDDLATNPLTVTLVLRSNRYTRFSPSNTDGLSFEFENVPAGDYTFWVHVANLGYATFSNTALSTVTVTPGEITVVHTTSSLAGGSNLVLNGPGFDTLNPSNNNIEVCGYECVVDEDTITFD